jgi:hypothetical protein
MAVEFYQRVRQLFEEALEHADSERMPFLQAACTGDPTLLQAVEQLLRARNSPALFLETAPGAFSSAVSWAAEPWVWCTTRSIR